jgi:hypothetical protein
MRFSGETVTGRITESPINPTLLHRGDNNS